MRTISSVRHLAWVPRVALLIDRDSLTARRARRVLRRAGYRVERSDAASVEHVARTRPDLIVLAMRGGGDPVDGHEAVAFVQDLRRSSRAPLLITTPRTSDVVMDTWLGCARAVEEATAVRAPLEAATWLDRTLSLVETVALDMALSWASRFGRRDAVPCPAPVNARGDGGDDAPGPGE